jgi:hypothetical protein
MAEQLRSGGMSVPKEREPLDNDGTRMDAVVGQLVLLQPIRQERWNTSQGERDTTVCRVIECGPNGSYTDHGDLPIFWTVVQEQLWRDSTDEYPWVVGVIRKAPAREGTTRTPPYVIQAPTPNEARDAGASLSTWQATPEAERRAARAEDAPF